MSTSRRFFLKAASTVAVGTFLPVSAMSKIVSTPVPSKYEMTANMVYSIVEVDANSEEATRRFGILLTYMLENFEPPEAHHINEARKKLDNKVTLDDIATLHNTMSDGIYPVAITKFVIRNTSVSAFSKEWRKFGSIYQDVILNHRS